MQTVLDLKIGLRWNDVLNVLLVNSLAFIEGFGKAPSIVECHILIWCACDGIMMSHDCHDVLRVLSLIQSLLDFPISCLLLEHLEGKEARLGMEQTRVISHLLFKARPWAKVARPVDHMIALVRHHIEVASYRPLNTLIFQCLNVSRWCRIDEGHIVSVVRIAVFYDAVPLFEAMILVWADKIVAKEDNSIPFAHLRVRNICSVILQLGASFIKIES